MKHLNHFSLHLIQTDPLGRKQTDKDVNPVLVYE